MQLTRKFFTALAPCVIACAQALAGPSVAAETVSPVREPVLVSALVNMHSVPSAQISYMEWRRRLVEMQAEVARDAIQASFFNGQIVASLPLHQAPQPA